MIIGYLDSSWIAMIEGYNPNFLVMAREVADPDSRVQIRLHTPTLQQYKHLSPDSPPARPGTG